MISRNSGMMRLQCGVLLGAALSLGCAEERDPINRVQAGALEKRFFVGERLEDPIDDPEFYSAATLIDVPYGVDHGLFSGMAGGLKRLKWEITEEQLVARATFESYEGVDGRGSRRTNDGQAIAAFKIVSHFDVKRDYNPSTGEELNVINENTSDSPWYERQFFRVDWSQNLITSSLWWDPLAQNNMFEDSAYDVEPLAYYVNDPENPDYTVFSAEEGYFDITQKVFVTPRHLEIDGQSAPTCLWRGVWVSSGKSETGVCESSEIKVRMSFKRVLQAGEPGHQEYEPKNWDGARMDAFGIFVQERKGYDNHYGVIDDNWYRFAQRYNIWQESFAKDGAGQLIACGLENEYAGDPNRDADLNGTDDECENAGAGSQCNTVVRACALPYAQRRVATVAWHHHLMAEDPTIVDYSEAATVEWDAAMRTAVQAARQAECRRTQGASVAGTDFAKAYAAALDDSGNANAACESTFAILQGEEEELRQVKALNRCWDRNGRGSEACAPGSGVAAIAPVIAFCHNPVLGPVRSEAGEQIKAGDHPACGEPGLVTRPGDIRYHSINIWPTPEDSSPWGFGPSWADPLTGEIIQASINVYNAVTDRSAQSVVDKARWYAGELDNSDILSGQYIRAWVGADDATRRLAGRALIPRAEVDRRLLGMNQATAESFANAPALRQLLTEAHGPKALQQQLLASVAPPPVGGGNRALFQARIDAVRGTPLEAELVGPMWFDAAAVDPAAPGALQAASPLGGANIRKRLDLEEAVQRRLAQNGMCMYELEVPEPSSVTALGQLLSRKFGAYDPTASAIVQAERVSRMWEYVRGKMHYGVLLHEMGHTIGLRHNFTSSYDKFNYRPQYWQLRTKDNAAGDRVTELCTDADTDPTGEDCIGPRYYDPLTPAEIDNSIYTWAQTTVMEYSGELTHDWLGLGVYDYAAARMFYGDVVDVRRDLSFSCNGDACRADSEAAEAAAGFVDYPGYLQSQSVEVTTPEQRSLNYSEWNAFFPLVAGCRQATQEELSPPEDWNVQRDGEWDAVFDGEIINGEVCRRPVVTPYAWREMRADEVNDLGFREDPQYFTPRRSRTRPELNGEGKSYVRVPYSFASDEFRDGWSPSTLTRDTGADVYEETLWFIHQYENGHIWNNFRNQRTGFSIVGSYRRELERYHVKLGNVAQGLSIMHDYWFRELAKNGGFSHAEIVAAYEAEGGPMRDHAVAAAAVFDHFMRVLTRPQAGVHYPVRDSDGMYVSGQDRIGSQPSNFLPTLTIPNGTTLLGQDVTFGGRPLDNGFEYGRGYWYFDYVNQAGSYYEKTYAFDMLLNALYRVPYAFSRWDGIDGRWRHTNFVNLFPEGMRRMLGLMLTEDFQLIGPRVTARGGVPDLTRAADNVEYPTSPLGWVSFVPADGPEHCYPSAGNFVCRDTLSSAVLGGTDPESVVLEPQIGFEIQKFLAFWAYVYMPGNQIMDFVDMMRIWKVGDDVDPQFAGRYIAWIDPDSDLRYYARRHGDEVIFGKTYDKGIAAKMLAWANELTGKAYVLDETTPYDPVTGAANVTRHPDGTPVIKGDGLTRTTNDPLTCDDNRYCTQLRKYRGLIDFTRDMGHQVGFFEPQLPTTER